MSERTVSRRSVLAGTAGLITTTAGCISTSSSPPGSGGNETTESGDGSTVSQLRIGGSSTVYPITDKASSYWNGNPEAGQDYWTPSEYGLQTDKRLANYWASLHGFDASSGAPVFRTSVSLSHSGIGLQNLKEGRLDIGNASAPVQAELDLSESEYAKFKDHVVGVDAQPIVVSSEIYEAGVTGLKADTLRAIYKGEIKNWQNVPGYEGPPKQIQCVGRAEGSGTDTAFRANLFGNPDAPIPGVDVRKGENQEVQSTVKKSDNAIAYMALAFVGEGVKAISLTFEGKTFTPGENLADKDYPLARDLHCYTYGGTSSKEAAFIHMILSDFGQQNLVKPAGYAALTDERREEEISKLPGTA
ncbi:MAG: PstS family phosphate ABC transporter substrate-binding protein [Halobacterium sp.]